MKTKKKFINVAPKTSKSKNRFVNQMDSLHAMEVEQEKMTPYQQAMVDLETKKLGIEKSTSDYARLNDDTLYNQKT
jgi:hypothetical protein